MNIVIQELTGLLDMLMVIELYILIALELNIFQKELESLEVIRILQQIYLEYKHITHMLADHILTIQVYFHYIILRKMIKFILYLYLKNMNI